MTGPAKGSESTAVLGDLKNPLTERRFLPVEPFIPYIQAWIDEFGINGLTNLVGVDCCGLSRIVHGHRDYVSFMVMDRLFAAVGRTDLWHTELAHIYEEAA